MLPISENVAPENEQVLYKSLLCQMYVILRHTNWS